MKAFFPAVLAVSLFSQISMAGVATYTCKANQLSAGAVLKVVDDSTKSDATLSVGETSQSAAKVSLDLAKSADQMPRICQLAQVDCAKVASAKMYHTVINGFLMVDLIELFDAKNVNIGQVYAGNTMPMACDK